jgi:hypothetical protein
MQDAPASAIFRYIQLSFWKEKAISVWSLESSGLSCSGVEVGGP